MTNPSLPKTPTAARRLQINRERAATLHPRFLGIEARPSDRPLTARLGTIARRLNGKPFKTVSDVQWKISPKTAIRLFYHWRAAGRVSESLFFKYSRSCAPHARLTVEHLLRFIDELSKPCTRSGVDAFRRLCGAAHELRPPVSYSTLIRHLPKRAHRRIAAARAAVHQAQGALAAVVNGMEAQALGSAPKLAANPGAPLSFEI